MDDLCGVTDPNFIACSLPYGHKGLCVFDREIDYESWESAPAGMPGEREGPCPGQQ